MMHLICQAAQTAGHCPIKGVDEACHAIAQNPALIGFLVAAGIIGIVIGLLLAKACCCPSRRAGGAGGACKPGHPCHRDGSEDNGCVEIYVGNLSYDLTEDAMRKEFEKFGTVQSARIITNRFNSKSKGYGFVEMPNRPEAEAAIAALNDADVLGRKLRVNEAKNKSHE